MQKYFKSYINYLTTAIKKVLNPNNQGNSKILSITPIRDGWSSVIGNKKEIELYANSIENNRCGKVLTF